MRPLRHIAVAVLLSAAVAGGQQAALAAPEPAQAPVVGTDVRGVIPGQFIVVLKSGETTRSVKALGTLRKQKRVQREYHSVVQGFAAELTSAALATLRRDPAVAYVEADRVMSVDATQSPATWGLDRIDQRNRPVNNSYTYNATGAGVNAYVIDTGIRTTHQEFGGRATGGFTAINDGRGTTDCNGHGTHVAGTIGGSTYGVAKAVSLVAVRVLDCNGSGATSGVIAGVDWVTANHRGPSVANMSLGGGGSTALDNAVKRSIASGVSYAVAAGNDGFFTTGSPARVPEAITVGASTNQDGIATFSNFGKELDLFAPGASITSSWITNDTATNTISGTSMATPHVAGAAALYLQGNPGAAPAAVSTALVNASTKNVLSGGWQFWFGTPNRLLYTL